MKKSQKALVTGAGGFIGSHLVESLMEKGYHVRAFVRYTSMGGWGWLESLPAPRKNEIEVVRGDIRDSECVQRSVKDIDVVFHLAALIGIPYSYEAPESYVQTNIGGTLNVLQACRKAETRRVLVTSTSEVYGTARYTPIDESHPFQAQSPYSATKIAADRLGESFYRSYGLPVTIVRPFNTYGPRQSMRAVIPTIIAQLLAGKTAISLGSLNPTRDFCYVRDTVEGFSTIAEHDATVGEEINIATGREISILEIAQMLIEMINPDATLKQDNGRVRPNNSEVERLCGSNEKVKTLTTWTPRFSLADGLKETVSFLRGNLGKYKTSAYGI